MVCLFFHTPWGEVFWDVLGMNFFSPRVCASVGGFSYWCAQCWARLLQLPLPYSCNVCTYVLGRVLYVYRVRLGLVIATVLSLVLSFVYIYMYVCSPPRVRVNNWLHVEWVLCRLWIFSPLQTENVPPGYFLCVPGAFSSRCIIGVVNAVIAPCLLRQFFRVSMLFCPQRCGISLHVCMCVVSGFDVAQAFSQSL